MKNRLLSLVLFLFTTSMSMAQDTISVAVTKNRYINFDFGVGYLHTDLSNINGFLASHGYRAIPDDMVTLSLSPSFFANRFVFRGEYTWQFPVSTPQSENIRSTFGSRHVAASVGYVLYQKPGFRIYPFVGINSFTSQLMVREKTSVSNADALVNHQQRAFHLRYSNASLDVGLQFDKMISLKNRRWDCPQNARFMTLGLRAGYLLSPKGIKGRFNGEVVSDAPTYAPKGPYLKLVIGFSTKVRDLKWKSE